MRLYTKQGDDGDTGLIGGQRVRKDHVRVAAYGDVDELNAIMGCVVSACEDETWRARMLEIQNILFNLGAHLANPEADETSLKSIVDAIATMEGWIDAACEEVPPLQNFVLPGGTELASRLHLARTVCRRAERSCVQLKVREGISSLAVVYLNRLSDLLFAWARLANHRAGMAETIWRGEN